jgi:hypothetical protein
MRFLPINGVPVDGRVGNRTSRYSCRHLLCLISRLVKLSRKERPDGSLLAFAWDAIALPLNPYPVHYSPAFAFSILLCPQFYRLALRFTFPGGRTTGLPCSAYMPLDGLGVCSFAGDFMSACQQGGSRTASHFTFWFKPLSIFGLFVLTTFICSSHVLPLPSYPSACTA